MSLRFARQDKEGAVDLILLVLQKLTFHGISRVQQERVVQHMTALKLQDELDIQCRVESSERTGATQITISVIPITRLPDAKPH